MTLQATTSERRAMNLLFNLFNSASNLVQNAVGINRTLDELIRDKDISKAITIFQNRDDIVEQALSEYNPKDHKINFRPDKKREGKAPKKSNKLPSSKQRLINEIETNFLYGNDPQWTQNSTGTDRAFEVFTETLKKIRWSTTQRQLKRIAGAETEAAKLFYVYKDERTGKPKIGVKILAYSKGDEIRPLFDQYENMVSFGHGYYLKEGTKTVKHFDIYYPNVIWRCRKLDIGWEIIAENNPIGKIPIDYVCQDKAWEGGQPQIERSEELRSRVADTNDYVADPILLLTLNLVNSLLANKENNKNGVLPNPEEPGKVLGVDDVNAAKYLTIDTAVDLKAKEIEDLDEQTNQYTMTPAMSTKALIDAGAQTGPALKRAMALGYMKRAKNMEIYAISHDREANIIKAIIGNVLDISLKEEMERLEVSCKFSEPFQDDVTEKINNLIRLYDAGGISLETMLSQIEYIDDVAGELDRIAKEAKERKAEEAEKRGTLLQEFERNNQQNEEEDGE